MPQIYAKKTSFSSFIQINLLKDMSVSLKGFSLVWASFRLILKLQWTQKNVGL